MAKLIRKSDITPLKIHYKFKESIFINPNNIKCKNCKIILCSYLAYFIREYFSIYDAENTMMQYQSLINFHKS